MEERIENGIVDTPATELQVPNVAQAPQVQIGANEIAEGLQETEPQEQHVNSPIIKDIEEIVDKKFVALKGNLVGIYIFKGSVATYQDLPTIATVQASGWVYNVEDTGDNYASVITDGVLSWDKLGGTVDLSNYVTLDSAQTITAKKTMNNGTNISPELTFVSQNTSTSIKQDGYQLYIGDRYSHIQTGKITPFVDNGCILGSAYNKWQYVYTNNISNGTDSASVYQLANGVMGMQAPSSETLTDAEYAELTNGKPHQIVGTFLGSNNPFLFAATLTGSYYHGLMIFNNSSYQINDIVSYDINVNTKVIRTRNSYIRLNNAANQVGIFGGFNLLSKSFPSYPTDTTKQYKLVQNVGGTLAWVEDVASGSVIYEHRVRIALGNNVYAQFNMYDTNSTAIDSKSLLATRVPSTNTAIIAQGQYGGVGNISISNNTNIFVSALVMSSATEYTLINQTTTWSNVGTITDTVTQR